MIRSCSRKLAKEQLDDEQLKEAYPRRSSRIADRSLEKIVIWLGFLGLGERFFRSWVVQ